MQSNERPMHLLPKEVAARLRINVGTLANWRTAGCGPKFIKFGHKILYPLSEIEAFEKASLRSNTTGVRDMYR